MPGALDKGLAPLVGADARFASADFTALRLEALRIALAGGGRLEGEAHANLERVNALLQASALDLRALRSDLRRTSPARAARAFRSTREAQAHRRQLLAGGHEPRRARRAAAATGSTCASCSPRRRAAK
jgi:hypothetical protein